MTTPVQNFYVRIDLILNKFNSPLKTVTFVNKAVFDVPDYWPILTGVGDPTLQAGEFLPSQTFSSFTVRNDVGSFGASRKLSDVLELYTPVDQQVTVYIAAVGTDVNTVGGWGSPVFTCLCSRWTQTGFGADNSVTFELKSLTARDPVLTLEVSREVPGMESAPGGSLGKVVPLLVGAGVDVVPTRITGDGATTAAYAWGTCLTNYTKNTSTGYSLYTKNRFDAWTAWGTGNPDYSGSGVAGQYGLDQYDSQAFRFNVNVSTVITGLQLRGKGNGSGGRVSTAFLGVFVLRVDRQSYAVLEEVGRGQVSLAYYDAQNNAGTASFPINISFDKPVYVWGEDPVAEYYFGFEAFGYQPNELSLNYTGFNRTRLIKDATSTAAYDSPNAWRLLSLIADCPNYKMHELAPTVSNHVAGGTSAGLTYSSLTLAQFTPDTGQANPALDDLPVLLGNVSGVTPFAGSTPVQSTELVAKLLGATWNPFAGAWSDSTTWDTTTYAALYQELYTAGVSPGVRNRQPVAVFDSRVTYSQILSELCRGTASRVGVRANGSTFMMPWGGYLAPAADIAPADVTPEQWAQADVSAVVNRVTVSTGLSFQLGTGTGANEYGYRYTTDFNAGGFARVYEMTLESRSTYGERSIGEVGFPVHPQSSTGQGAYLGGEGSVIAEYYLARFAKPPVYATFLVPWNKYQSLEMFQVVTFAHPDFPAYQGTDPDARVPVLTGASAAEADLLSGYDWVRAQTYRGLVERITYVLPADHAPQLRLTVLVLLNPSFDPT